MTGLRERMSFRRKKNTNASDTSLPLSDTIGGSSFTSFNNLTQGQGDGPVPPPMLAPIDENQEEQNLQTVLELSALHSQLEQAQTVHQRLEAQLEFDRQNHRESTRSGEELVAGLVQRNQFLEMESSTHQSRISALNANITRERHRADSATAQSERLKCENLAMGDELQRFRQWAVRVSGNEEKVRQVEERNAWLVRNADGSQAGEVYKEKLQFEEQTKELRRQIEEGRAELAKMAGKLEEGKKVVEQEIAERAKLEMEIDKKDMVAEALRQDIKDAEEQAVNAEAIMTEEVLAKRQAVREKEEVIAVTLATKGKPWEILGSNVTARTVLALKFLEKRSPPGDTEENTRAQQFLQSRCSTRLLNSEVLDIPLTGEQVTQLSDNITRDESVSESLGLLICTVCRTPKFASSNPAGGINEFPVLGGNITQQMPCCKRAICSFCFRDSLIGSVNWGWWHNLNAIEWIPCPATDCASSLKIKCSGELAVHLRSVGVEPRAAVELIAKFDRASIFRKALAEMTPRPTPEALQVASDLHAHLVAGGRMKSLFDSCFDSTEPDAKGRPKPFDPGEIRTVETEMTTPRMWDQGPEVTRTVSIPLLMRFFNRRQTECVVCSETVVEIKYGDTAMDWREFCEGFTGPWMWDILFFPVKLAVGCESLRHEADICRECLGTHLKTQLDQYGRDHCERLSCPSEGCGRPLGYDEVKMFADSETFEKYDRFHLLNNLCADPNFRWCLREGCDYGQIWDPDMTPHLMCDECAFEMCFHHQLPWHEDLSCEQYDSERSEDFLGSAQWIEENSKKCPGAGCGVNIIKGEACFHMTCTRCRFEFCWVCLADWSLINPQSGGYVRDAHKEGCWFRDNNVEPTQVFGAEVEAAARRRNRE